MNSSNLPIAEPTFDIALAMCIAENRVAVVHKPWDDDELMLQFDLTNEQYSAIKQSPAFAKAVNKCVVELKQSGGAIETKAEKLYEYYMDTYIPKLMADDEAAHSDKLKALDRLAKTSKKLSNMEVKSTAPSQAMPTLNIILPPMPAAPAVQVMKDVTNES